jgi:NAD(P)H dehydrogenase (quinone)
MRDLYRMNFSPVLQASEIPEAKGFWPRPDVSSERAELMNVDVFCFVYPVWFCTPPAILTGYVQRAFGMGFGYGAQQGGENQRLLLQRSMISFSSSGAPAEWMHADGTLAAMQRIFDNHLAAVCGMRMLEHKHFGHVVGACPKIGWKSIWRRSASSL